MATTKQKLLYWGKTAKLFQTSFSPMLYFHLASSPPLDLPRSKLWDF